MGDLAYDLRFSWRTLRRSPLLTTAVVLSLALGIGANATVFTFVRAVLLPPLPVEEPRRLMSVYTRDEQTPYYLPNSYLNYQDCRRMNGVFSDMLAQWTIPMSLGGGEEAERIVGQIVSGNYFSVLGVAPQPGRGFLVEEDRTPGSHPVAVVSHGLWQRLGGDAGLVGRQVTLDGHAFTVVGVAPRGFTGTAVGVAVEVWVPMMMHPQVLSTYSERVEQRQTLIFDVVGRLKPGIGVKQADAAMKTLARQLEQEYPAANKGRTLDLVPLQEARVNPNARAGVVLTSLFLTVVVALVLLIACVNLANLQLARIAARRRELGMRVALGAGRGRLVRQLLTESFVLALLGGALGLAFATWAKRFLWALVPTGDYPVVLDLDVGADVLVFTLAISLAAGLAFGLAPALRTSRSDVLGVLKDQGAVAGGGRRRLPLRNLLVVSQVCGSLVLLVAATLFVKSLKNARDIDPGFSVNNVLVISVDPGLHGYGEAQSRALYRQVLERARALPGVRFAALAADPPMGANNYRFVLPEPRDGAAPDQAALVLVNLTGPGWFETVGMPLVQGRDFSERDVEGMPRVAIVNETMARKYWPGESPLERRFRIKDDDPCCDVVGVARDSKYASLGEAPQPFFYLPLEQNFVPMAKLHLRTAGDPAAAAGALRAELQRADEKVRLLNLKTLRQQLSASLWLPRMGAALVGFFGLLGLLLATVGLYGVMANAVAQRTQEVGVRMALGGTPRQVFALVFGDGLRLLLAGLVLGLIAASVATRGLSRLLYGVAAGDPAAFAGATAVLALVGVLATCVPARAATRVDPLVALRSE